MEGGLCRGIEEGVLGEKSLSGFVGLRKECRGIKVYRDFEKLYFYYMFFLKYCADVKNCGSFKSFGFIYIYIYIYIDYIVKKLLTKLMFSLKYLESREELQR